MGNHDCCTDSKQDEERPYQILRGDCLELLKNMADNSIDSIVTDPPYHLTTGKKGGTGPASLNEKSPAGRARISTGFMGQAWDGGDIAFRVELWRECLRVLKPGGHLLAFSGSRTYHRMACAIEDAGFEMRDMIAWVYGCLDEATEVATEFGVMPYHKTKVGDRVLCYDAAHGEYTYQPILEVVEYDYSDTAYRLVGDFGEQVVSRNHRVIVERGGSEAFQLAETLECEARVPVLESLPALRQAIHDAHQGAGRPQQDVQCDLCEFVDRCSECRDDAAGTTQGCDDQVRGLRDERVEAGCVAAQGGDADMQQEVQRRAARCGVGEACTQRSGALVGRVGDGAEGAHDGRVQPGLEGRVDISQPEGSLRRSADQVRAMPCGSDEHGSGGRLCHGASSCGGAGSWEAADASGVRASHQPRCDGQSAGEPDAVRHERTAQGIRAWGGHRSAVVRVVPFHYTGKVWCLRVPTGAFVAVRNGVAFPTGNSGFPKSLDVSKAIDKAAGAERTEVVGVKAGHGDFAGRKTKGHIDFKNGTDGFDRPWMHDDDKRAAYHMETAPATDAARQWSGWGTALKPAIEPIAVGRKPLIGTVAANVLQHGTGALNIDGCRVPTNDNLNGGAYSENRKPSDSEWVKHGGTIHSFAGIQSFAGKEYKQPDGRFPANLIHDGSAEVVALFPESNGAGVSVPNVKVTGYGGGIGTGKSEYTPGDRQTFDSGNGSAARFFKKCEYDTEDIEAATLFYCAKASRRDRNEGMNDPGDQFKHGATLRAVENTETRGNFHPTVKPTDLCRWLLRLVTPPGGTSLDIFCGSGSFGKAAMLEGFSWIGMDLDSDENGEPLGYLDITRARVEHAYKSVHEKKQEPESGERSAQMLLFSEAL